MDKAIPIDEVRVLRKILSGIDMVFNTDDIEITQDTPMPMTILSIGMEIKV